jgi:hypothetical protein
MKKKIRKMKTSGIKILSPFEKASRDAMLFGSALHDALMLSKTLDLARDPVGFGKFILQNPVLARGFVSISSTTISC